MFHRKQSTLPELGDIEHIGVTLPVISELEQCHLVFGAFLIKFDLCNIAVQYCMYMLMNMNITFTQVLRSDDTFLNFM